MMNDGQHKSIDERLRTWSRDQELSAEQVENLVQSTLARLSDTSDKSDRSDEVLVELPARAQADSRQGVLAALLVLAASLLIMGIWRFNDRQSRLRRAAERIAADHAAKETNTKGRLSSIEEETNRGRLFASINRDFDSRLAWLAETSDDLKFELTESKTETNEPLIFIRLALADDSPKPAAFDSKRKYVDLIVRNDQSVVLMQRANSPQILVWPHLTEDGKLLVESELRTAAGTTLANQTILVSPLETPNLDEPDKSSPLQVRSVRVLTLPAT